ncbi:hypothetical protein C0995_009173 [Termitomyces sp. Mi166|nr:hypothetical protein C0995_009173 [Termitomyces sp. Mi166\
MDSLHFDPYAAASTPRTPSPHDVPFVPHDFKQLPVPHEPRIYDDDDSCFSQPFYASRGSLLQELYDHDLAEQQHHQQQPPPQQPYPDQWQQPQYHIVRRATFPYVRHDRDDQYAPPFIHYPEPIPEAQEFAYHDFDDTAPSIKLEDTTASLIVPSQSPAAAFYSRPPPMSYLSPHTGLPVQHTDDAASKETQYLRRRCFNCHTTEPPSWRRSTLNPGKIVCNKCGLYERTHLRPRPLRFDELRAGNKARTNNKTKPGAPTPKPKIPTIIKKEPREFGLVRRSSVSSSHSGSGASDWDDNVSVYSSGSAPPTSFNSPNTNTFPLDRDSQSPPRDGGIRLPNAPLSDLAPSPRKAHTLPLSYYSPPATDYVPRAEHHSSAPQSPQLDGWQPVVTASPQSTALEISIPTPEEPIETVSS